MPKFHPNILHHLCLEYNADESALQIPHQYQSLCLHWYTFIENHIAVMPERTIGIQELLPHPEHVQVSIEREFHVSISYSLLLSLHSLSHLFPMVVQLSALCCLQHQYHCRNSQNHQLCMAYEKVHWGHDEQFPVYA